MRSFFNKEIKIRLMVNKKIAKFVVILMSILTIAFIPTWCYDCYNANRTSVSKNIADTDAINKIKDEVKEKYNENINIIVDDKKQTDIYSEEGSLAKFNEKCNNDENSILVCVAVNKCKISIVAGENIKGYLTPEIRSNMIDNARYYFRKGNYNKGIENMLKYYLNNHPSTNNETLDSSDDSKADKNSWVFKYDDRESIDLVKIGIVVVIIIVALIVYALSDSLFYELINTYREDRIKRTSSKFAWLVKGSLSKHYIYVLAPKGADKDVYYINHEDMCIGKKDPNKVKASISCILCVLMFFMVVTCYGYNYFVRNYSNVDNVIASDIGDTLKTKELVDKIEKKYNIPMHIVVVNNQVSNESIEEEADNKSFELYGYNKNSATIYIATKDKKIAIKTGRNAENVLSSETCADMIKIFEPYLKKGEYNDGINEMLNYLIKQSSGKKSLIATSTSNNSNKHDDKDEKDNQTANDQSNSDYLSALSFPAVIGLVGFIIAYYIKEKNNS